jgi:hypothetical protein
MNRATNLWWEMLLETIHYYIAPGINRKQIATKAC